MIMRQEENSLKELEAMQKIAPFPPFATSHGMGWKGLEAHRYHNSPASGELRLSPVSYHSLVLITPS
ncbi:MAG TPA: hypothetical protein VE242_03995 [Chthoniobacterales bacterium]|nr:hypothetical protein [Chthoniobacterales bacterium]